MAEVVEVHVLPLLRLSHSLPSTEARPTLCSDSAIGVGCVGTAKHKQGPCSFPLSVSTGSKTLRSKMLAYTVHLSFGSLP